LSRLAQRLRRRRFARFALNLEIPECEIVLGEDGRITGLRPLHSDPAHQLVEECMIAANEAVAAELHDRRRGYISRHHSRPTEEKIEELTILLQGMGYEPGDLKQRRNLSAFLKSIENNPLADHVRIAVLRSMSRAVYSADDTGHYGLAKKFYAHFTSPIRRYPDLVAHRELEAVLAQGAGPVYDRATLAEIATSCTETEWQADEAERQLLEIKKYRYLQQQLDSGAPDVYDAVVVKLVNFGMFVEIQDLQLQGLVHVSSMSDAFVRFNRKRQTLRAGRKSYAFGDKVRVRVSGVDFDSRRIDFELAN
jgi:ribonuclease R